jgi:hypothetical protein
MAISKPILEQSLEEYRKQMSVNGMDPFLPQESIPRYIILWKERIHTIHRHLLPVLFQRLFQDGLFGVHSSIRDNYKGRGRFRQD